jgi:hypothetical protein
MIIKKRIRRLLMSILLMELWDGKVLKDLILKRLKEIKKK